MNKKCTLLAAALMMAGTFTAHAATGVPEGEWTAGNYYYLQDANGNYLSLYGSKADSVIVTDALNPTKAANDSALWQIANKQSAMGVTSYQITNKATGQLLSFAAQANANLNLATGVDRWVISASGITGYYGSNSLTLYVNGSNLELSSATTSSTEFTIEAPAANFPLNADGLGNGFSVFQLMFGDTYEGNIFAGKQLVAKDLSGADAGYVSLQFQGNESFPNGKARLLGLDTTKTVISGAQGAYGAKFIADSTYAVSSMHTVANADFQKFKFTVNLKNDSLAMYVKGAPNVNVTPIVPLPDSVRVVFAQVGATKVLTVSEVDANSLPLQGALPKIMSSKGTPTMIPTGSGVYFMKSASVGANGGKYYVTSTSFMGGDSVPSVNMARGQWYIKESNGKYSIVDRQSNTTFAMNAEAFAVQGMTNTYTFGNMTDSVTVEFQQVDLNNKYLGSMHFTESELNENGYVLNLVSGTSGVNNIYAYTTDSILKGQASEASEASIFKLIPSETNKVGGALALGDTLYLTSYKLKGQFDTDTITNQGDSLKFSKAAALPFTFISDAAGKMYTMMTPSGMYVGMNVSTSCVQLSNKVAYVTLTAVESPEYGSFASGHKRLMNNNNSLVMNPLSFFAQLKSEGNPILKADYSADNFSLWVEQASVVDGKQLYFISSGMTNGTKADAATRYYLAAKDTTQGIISGIGTYAMFLYNDTIKTQANSPALFAFKTSQLGGYYLENQKELKANRNPYVGVVNGFAVLQASMDPNAAFVVETVEAPTSNEQVSVSDITVISNGGQIIVANASGRKITVSNILGQVLSSGRASSDNYSVPASKGIILVTVEGDNTYKVIVK